MSRRVECGRLRGWRGERLKGDSVWGLPGAKGFGCGEGECVMSRAALDQVPAEVPCCHKCC